MCVRRSDAVVGRTLPQPRAASRPILFQFLSELVHDVGMRGSPARGGRVSDVWYVCISALTAPGLLTLRGHIVLVSSRSV